MAVKTSALGTFCAISVLGSVCVSGQAIAQNNPRHAQIVVDADTLEVIYEENAQAPRRPASITKVMTLYLLFDALKNGSISWDDQIVFSRNAANQPPTKLGVRAGGSISVQTAIQAMVLRSANDVATAVAERIGGSHSNFANLMTAKARALGMSSTTFGNASGLTTARQITTAEDLARLAIAIRRDFPEHYHWFSDTEMTWGSQTILGHNHLMARMPGMDGLKTGYTAASGFNLAATTTRSGRHIVTIVLGGRNRFERDDLVEALTETAFKEMGIGTNLFASGSNPYDFSYSDSRDAADVAALVMDMPLPPITTGGSTTLALARSGRRLGFEPGRPTFTVANMAVTTQAPRGRVSSSPTQTNEGTDEEEAAPAPNRRQTASAYSVPVSNSALTTQRPVLSTPVAAPTPVLFGTQINSQAASARTSPRAEQLTTLKVEALSDAAKPTLRGPIEASTLVALNELPKAVEQVGERVPEVVQVASTVAMSQSATSATELASVAAVNETSPSKSVEFAENEPPAPMMIYTTARGDANETIATATDSRSIQMAENVLLQPPTYTAPAPEAIVAPQSDTEAPTTEALAFPPVVETETSPSAITVTQPVDAEMQMAEVALDPIVAAQLRQAEASAREAARLEDARVAEERLREQRQLAAKEVQERRSAERVLAESRERAQQERDERARLVTERQERADAAKKEHQRQAEAAAARGNTVVQVGAFRSQGDARAALAQFARHFPTFAEREVSTVRRTDGVWYRARFTGVGVRVAREACRLVSGRGGACQIVADQD